MRSFYILTSALDYIECNLCEPIALYDIASKCHFSLSGLHKMFSYVFGYSLKEYITKRRLSYAIYDLVNTDSTITDIALNYQYNSLETFTRAFIKFCGEPPSVYRKHHRFAQIFPKLYLNNEGGDTPVKRVDITDLYLELRNLADSYVICTDNINFMAVNDNYGIPAGDIVLAKTAMRLGECTTDDMIVFRTGNDEFAIVTRLYSYDDVKVLADKIKSLNGQTVEAGEHQIPISLRVAIIQIPKSLNYHELFTNMHKSIEQERRN